MLVRTKRKISGFISPSMIFVTAQLALVVTISLSQFNIPNTDFIQGLLCGYSVVGNLFQLVQITRNRKEER